MADADDNLFDFLLDCNFQGSSEEQRLAIGLDGRCGRKLLGKLVSAKIITFFEVRGEHLQRRGRRCSLKASAKRPRAPSRGASLSTMTTAKTSISHDD